MDKIQLNKVRPHVFADAELQSQVWDELLMFQAEQFYLVEASSGKGKSSLFSFLYGHRSDFSGEILFDGQDTKKLSPRCWDNLRTSELSLLFQELRLFPELTAYENIQLKNQLTHHKSRPQIEAMMESLGLADKLHTPCQKLSWGQQQRVAVIRCLCQPFRFLLLDEPISHLDDDNAAILSELICQEAQNQGAGVIVSSIGKHLPLSYHQHFSL